MIKKLLCSMACVLPLADVHARLAVEKVADQFTRPLWVGQPAGIDDKLWVVEQDGKIWIVDAKTGARGEKPFLDIVREVNRNGNELGLLGLAFAPDFKTSGRYYVNFTDKARKTRIVRFIANKGLTDTDPAGGGNSFHLRPTVQQPQRRSARLRSGRHALHRDGRRRGRR